MVARLRGLRWKRSLLVRPAGTLLSPSRPTCSPTPPRCLPNPGSQSFERYSDEAALQAAEAHLPRSHGSGGLAAGALPAAAAGAAAAPLSIQLSSGKSLSMSPTDLDSQGAPWGGSGWACVCCAATGSVQPEACLFSHLVAIDCLLAASHPHAMQPAPRHLAPTASCPTSPKSFPRPPLPPPARPAPCTRALRPRLAAGAARPPSPRCRAISLRRPPAPARPWPAARRAAARRAASPLSRVGGWQGKSSRGCECGVCPGNGSFPCSAQFEASHPHPCHPHPCQASVGCSGRRAPEWSWGLTAARLCLTLGVRWSPERVHTLSRRRCGGAGARSLYH